MLRRTMCTGLLALTLFAGIAYVDPATGDAQRGRRHVVEARAGQVTVAIPVSRARPGRTETQRSTRLPDTDWSCTASALGEGSIAVSCVTGDGHSLMIPVEGCGPVRFTLGEGRSEAPTYHVRITCR